MAGHIPSLPHRSLSTSLQPAPTVPPQFTAVQLFNHPAVQSALKKAPTSYPSTLQPPSARSTLLPYVQSFYKPQSVRFLHLYSPRLTSSAQYLIPNCHLTRRNLSLFRSAPLPPPRALAQIHLLETAANASPRYVEAQVAYYQALVDSGISTAFQRVITRWERMLEFVCPVRSLGCKSYN